MRVLKVRDSNSIPPKKHVRIVETKVGDLRNNRLQWIYTSYVEVPRVQPGELRLEILIDNWLLYDEKARSLDFQRKADWVNEWGKRCNQFAEHLIQHEIDFAQKYQIQFLERFYQSLRAKMRQSPESAFLQIGWGAGWTAKTVTLGYEQDFINKVYDRFRGLGRIQRRHRDCGGVIRWEQKDNVCTRCKEVVNRQDIELRLVQPFPKTRKIAFQNGQPHQPMGWVELRPASALKLKKE
jgi:CRISPR type III-A-associated RAMP protein Csm5